MPSLPFFQNRIRPVYATKAALIEALLRGVTVRLLGSGQSGKFAVSEIGWSGFVVVKDGRIISVI